MVKDRLVSMETSYTAESEKLRAEVSRLRGVEEDAKSKGIRLSSLQEELEKLKKELTTTRKEKKTIEDWAKTYRGEMEKVGADPSVESPVDVLVLHFPLQCSGTCFPYNSRFPYPELISDLDFPQRYVY